MCIGLSVRGRKLVSLREQSVSGGAKAVDKVVNDEAVEEGKHDIV